MPNCLQSALVAGLCLAWCTGAAPAPTTTKSLLKNAQAGLPESGVTNLVLRLGGMDFQTRETAQKDLQQLGPANLPQLLKLSESLKDPEIQIRLQPRIGQLQDFIATHPPNFTLHLKNAPIAAITRELSRQWGGAEPPPLVLFGDGPYTLDVDQMPFWDVMHELATQRQTTLAERSPSSELFPMSLPRNGYSRDGCLVYIHPMAYIPSDAADALPGAMLLRIPISVALDPRFQVVRASGPRTLVVTDDAGRTLLTPELAGPAIPADIFAGCSIISTFEYVSIPKNVGKTITLKGDAKFEIEVTHTHEAVADLEKHIGQIFNSTGRPFSITKLAPTDTGLQFLADAPKENGSHPVRITILDVDDKPIWVEWIFGPTAATIPGQHKGPFKLLIDAPQRTVIVPFTFEFKDLPLP